MKVLLIVDAQVDFTSGALGSATAKGTADRLVEFVKNRRTEYQCVTATLDTHKAAEFHTKETAEGEVVPPHCIAGSTGAALVDGLAPFVDELRSKSTFMLRSKALFQGIGACADSPECTIDVCGFCTDICVVSNALKLRAEFPKARIRVLSDLCAGTTPQAHDAAIQVMKSCLIGAIESKDI